MAVPLVGSLRAGARGVGSVFRRAIEDIESAYGDPYMPAPELPPLRPYEPSVGTVIARGGLALIAGARARAAARLARERGDRAAERERLAMDELRARRQLSLARIQALQAGKPVDPLQAARLATEGARLRYWLGRQAGAPARSRLAAARATLQGLTAQREALEREIDADIAQTRAVISGWPGSRTAKQRSTRELEAIDEFWIGEKARRLSAFDRQNAARRTAALRKMAEEADLGEYFDEQADPLEGLRDLIGGPDDEFEDEE